MKVKKLLLSVVSIAMAITVVNVVKKDNTTFVDEQNKTVLSGNSSTVSLSEKSPISGEDVIIDLVDNKLQEDQKENDYLANDNKDEVVNENGEIKVPFDQAFPEIFEEGEIAYSKDSLMIKFKKSFDGELNKSLKNAGIAKLEKMFDLDDASWYTAYIKEKSDVKETMTEVRKMDNVIVAEYNFAYETMETGFEEVAGNPDFSKQWYMSQYGIGEAWNQSEGGGSQGVVVAVIDTGVDYTHKDLAANMWKNTGETPDNGIDDDGNGYIDDYYGVDMTKSNEYYNYPHGSGMDDHGHGTHVAGIIAAVNNNEGIVGLAYNTKIMTIKAGDASGTFLQNNIVNAILYAYKNGADVINMSFGGTASAIAIQDALALAYNRSVLVASAGNSGAQNETLNLYAPTIPNYPAALSYVIGVMSVDSGNMESSFTNFDAFEFNSVEYEVYAPGEQILSTIPGDRYATMSGTSMAAPVVAAQAALLRSYYIDRNTYPTKFIYGQIVGTADNKVTCCSPNSHLNHHIPGVVNFNDSIVELPQPDVHFSDYTIFDNEGLKNDTDKVNNGDGVIDAGETVALGFTLRNQWGMSKNTIVSATATNDFGVTCPYITILNNDIDYGSVGTYSQKDSGKIYTEDTWTGWENPFYIHISEKCPNDYTVTLNITVSYQNGLDENDTENYGSSSRVVLKIRNGKLVPNYINEDITLTNDNYYILPTAVTIEKGATLTIEPGTKIQFWTNDPEDSYAESAIVNIHVNGSLIAQGTAEDPIEMFPSDHFSDYAVIINRDYEGIVDLKHTIVTNPEIDANTIENCEFKQNYREIFRYRYYSGTSVYTSSTSGKVMADTIKGSAFYKLGAEWNKLSVRADELLEECIFVDCNVSINSPEMLNNVFYGNNSYDGTENGKQSEINTVTSSNDLNINQFFTLPVTGNSYMTVNYDSDRILERFLPYVDGNWVSLNSEEELKQLLNALIFETDDYNMSGYKTNISYNREDGYYYNGDGTKVNGRIKINMETDSPIHLTKVNNEPYFYTDDNNSIYDEYGNSKTIYTDYKVFEIAALYPINITLEEYVTNLTIDETYELKPTITPSNKEYPLVYTSENEAVATVDENGVITAVGAGTTNIRIYSEDLGTYNYLTVNVTEDVDLERIDVESEVIYLTVNDIRKVKTYFYPSNTTQRGLTYTSSDSKVATVNEFGYVEGLKEGKVTITITSEVGFSGKVEVIVSNPAQTLYYEEDTYYTNFDEEYLIPTTDIDVSLIEFESSHPHIAYVDEDGELIKLQEGTTTIRAKDRNSSASDDIQVTIDENIVNEAQIKKVQYAYGNNNNHIMLNEDGSIYVWNKLVPYANQLNIQNKIKIVDFSGYSNYGIYTLNEEGNVYFFDMDENKYYVETPILTNVKAFASSTTVTSPTIALTNNGELYMIVGGSWGDTKKIDLSTIRESVIDVAIISSSSGYDIAYILTESGLVYRSSVDFYNEPIFELVEANANDLYAFGYGWCISIDKDDEMVSYDQYGDIERVEKAYPKGKIDGNGRVWYINEGKIINTYNDGVIVESYTNALSKLTNVKDIFGYFEGLIIQLEDGRIYGYDRSENGSLPVGNSNSYVKTPTRIYLNSFEITDDLNILGNNTVVIDEEYDYPTLRGVGNREVDRDYDFERYGYKAISTKEDLINVTNDLDGRYYLTNDIEFTSDDFNSTNGNGWLPIGTFKNTDGTYRQEAFTGVFDGNGYAISGLRAPNVDVENVGLFAINYGTIRNLKVDKFNFYTRGSKQNYVGAIAGQSIGGTESGIGLIENCTVYGVITDTYRGIEMVCHFGGIVGYGRNANIRNCEVIGEEIYVINKMVSYVGGIVGYAINSDIQGCINETAINAPRYGGGIVGYMTGENAKVRRCINRGDISINGNANLQDVQFNLGGIAGEISSGLIENCYNDCMMGYSSGVASQYNIGGIAGVVGGTIKNCYNAGSMHFIGTPVVRENQVIVEYYSLSDKRFASTSFIWEEGKVYEPTTHVPTRDGYEFAGWYSMSTGEKFNGIFEPNCSYSFLAKWTPSGEVEEAVGQDAIDYCGDIHYPLTINLNGSNYISQDYGESLGYFDTYKYAIDGLTDYTGMDPKMWFNENHAKEGISFNINIPDHKYITSITCNGAPIEYSDNKFTIYPSFGCGLVIDVTMRDVNYSEVTISGTVENDGVVSVKNGTTMTSIDPGVKDGFRFVGWLDNEGNKFEFNQPITKDMKIYAKFLKTDVSLGDIAGYVKESTPNQIVSILNTYAIDSIDGVIGTNEGGVLSDVKVLTKQEAIYGSSYKDYDFLNTWDLPRIIGNEIVVTYDDAIFEGLTYNSIKLMDKVADQKVDCEVSIGLNTLHIKAKEKLVEGNTYSVILPTASVQNYYGSYVQKEEIIFIYFKEEPKEIVHELVIDEEIVAERETVSQERIDAFWKNFVKDGLNTRFYANAILNRTGNNDNVEQWLRIMAPGTNGYKSISYGGNYWGTLDEQLINLQIIDYLDYSGYADINHGIINEIPENTYPFVVNAYLEVNGEQVDTVGNQFVTFVVEFNRDMDTTIPLDVKFGSYYPYADYKVEGEYVDAKTWKGEMQLTTIIENGYQYWSVTNGMAANTSYKLYTDWGRFPFMIDTTEAQALVMQAESTSKGINLTWTQDDFDTLMGYNVYRSTSEDGYYTKLNSTLIPADTKEWLDDTVQPGQKYYYNFTVLKTDLTESEPSGKITAVALDTLAPNIYHTPIYEAFTGGNLLIGATIIDNVGVKEAKVYYRMTGTEQYNYATMYGVNDSYSALIPMDIITTEGLEYYIEVSDGITYTYKGSAQEPFAITIREAITENDMGDVDGNGVIELADAMKLLYAINDKYNMTSEEFERADLNDNGVLGAEEALRIIQYVNGTIDSVLMGDRNA